MNLFQSKQEEMIHTISRATFGTGRIFRPAICLGNREPADLAWTDGASAILFYCSESKKNREYQDRKNFRQAKWWARNWSDIVTLNSRDRLSDLSIPRSSIKKIYVCLINDAPNDHNMYIAHEKLSGVDGLVSTTYRFFLSFLQYFPNAYDFIQLFQGDFEVDGMSDDAAISVVSSAFEKAFIEGTRPISSSIDLSVDSILNESQSITQLIKEEAAKITSKELDLSLIDVGWITGALYAGTYDVTNSFNNNGDLKYARAKIVIRDRTFAALVTANIESPRNIFAEILDQIETDDFLLIHKFGLLPRFENVWMHAVGHSLGPDRRRIY